MKYFRGVLQTTIEGESLVLPPSFQKQLEKQGITRLYILEKTEMPGLGEGEKQGRYIFLFPFYYSWWWRRGVPVTERGIHLLPAVEESLESEDVTMVGVADRIEVWNPGDWEKFRERYAAEYNALDWKKLVKRP